MRRLRSVTPQVGCSNPGIDVVLDYREAEIPEFIVSLRISGPFGVGDVVEMPPLDESFDARPSDPRQFGVRDRNDLVLTSSELSKFALHAPQWVARMSSTKVRSSALNLCSFPLPGKQHE